MHLIFIVMHLAALYLFFPALFITLPLHVIAAVIGE